MEQTDLAYMAGLFDGEGTIVIHSNKHKKKDGVVAEYHYVEVCICSMDEWVPWHFKMAFLGNVYHRVDKIWVWQTVSQRAANFLVALLPYLQLKRRQAEIAIATQSRRKRHGRSPLAAEELALRVAEKKMISTLNHTRKAKDETNSGG